MDVVCDSCGEGYVLAYRGTKEAKCGEHNPQAGTAACLTLAAAVLPTPSIPRQLLWLIMSEHRMVHESGCSVTT